jgi:lipopolysaccharide export system protein LptC
VALRLTDRGQSRFHDTDSAAPERTGRFSRAWIMLGLVLVLAVVALLVIDRSAGPPMTRLPTPPLQGEPDIYMDGPAVSQYRQDGTLEYRLLAEDARHFQGDATTHLNGPALTLFRQQQPPWSVRAQRGTLHRPPGTPEETISLDGDVVLELTRPAGERLQLVTDSLQLFPRRQYAETDQDVMIRGRFGQTTATGLSGDLQLGVIRLFSSESGPVTTVLQPDQFK